MEGRSPGSLRSVRCPAGDAGVFGDRDGAWADNNDRRISDAEFETGIDLF